MAQYFVNSQSRNIGSVLQTIYTAPNNGAVVHSLFIANKNSNDVYVDIAYFDGSNVTYLGNNIIIPGNATLTWDKPINITGLHEIRISCDTASSADAFLSILEL